MSANAETLTKHSCDTHWFDPAVATCRDCDAGVCTRCAIPVARLGTFCRDCAMVRAGVRTTRRHSTS